MFHDVVRSDESVELPVPSTDGELKTTAQVDVASDAEVDARHKEEEATTERDVACQPHMMDGAGGTVYLPRRSSAIASATCMKQLDRGAHSSSSILNSAPSLSNSGEGKSNSCTQERRRIPILASAGKSGSASAPDHNPNANDVGSQPDG